MLSKLLLITHTTDTETVGNIELTWARERINGSVRVCQSCDQDIHFNFFKEFISVENIFR